MPVGFHDELGVPYSQVRSETGGSLIFRAVHPDSPARVGAALQGNAASFGALQVAAREAAVISPVIEQVLRIIFAAYLGGSRIRSSLEIVDRQRLVFGFAHEGDQAGAPLAIHLQRLRIDFPHHFLQLGAGSFHPLPIRRAIGILAMRIVGQHDDGLDFLIAHHGADARASGLLYAEKPLPSIDRLGDVVIMAVDAAIRRVGCADARGQESHMPLVISGGSKTFDEMPFQIKRFVVRRSFLQCHLPRIAVDNNHYAAGGFACNLQRIKSGILQISAEVSAEIGNSGNAGKRRQGHGHRLCGPGKLGYAPQRSIRDDQRIFRICGFGFGCRSLVQKVEAQAAPSQKVIPHLRIKLRSGNGSRVPGRRREFCWCSPVELVSW